MTRSAAVVATDYGGPEVLAVVEHDVSEPGPGDLLLEVRAAGVNPIRLEDLQRQPAPTRRRCRWRSAWRPRVWSRPSGPASRATAPATRSSPRARGRHRGPRVRGALLALTTYPLAEAAAAHRESIEGHPRGKLVLLP